MSVLEKSYVCSDTLIINVGSLLSYMERKEIALSNFTGVISQVDVLTAKAEEKD